MKDNKMANSSTQSGGIGVLGLLGVVFVTLKLCGVIDWSWWWVTAPFWAGIVIALTLFALAAAIMVAIRVAERKKRSSK